MDIFIILALVIIPFAILCLSYLVLAIRKKKFTRENKLATAITFLGLLVGLFFTYDSYKGASSMGGIYFIFWLFWSLVGGASVYLLSWLITKKYYKEK